MADSVEEVTEGVDEKIAVWVGKFWKGEEKQGDGEGWRRSGGVNWVVLGGGAPSPLVGERETGPCAAPLF